MRKKLLAVLLSICMVAGFGSSAEASPASGSTAAAVETSAVADAEVTSETQVSNEAEESSAELELQAADDTQENSGNVSESEGSSESESGGTATEQATQGETGDLTWTYADGTLTLSGVGDMEAPSTTKPVPWNSFSDNITTIVMKEGVESIPRQAFADLKALTSVTIPITVASIDIYAFYGCTALRELYIPSSVTTISQSVFMGCSTDLILYVAVAAGNVPSGWYAKFNTVSEGKTCSVIYDTGSRENYVEWSKFIQEKPRDYTIATSNIPDGILAMDANLKTVYIPNAGLITSLSANGPFEGCTNLQFIGVAAESAPSGWANGWNNLSAGNPIATVFGMSEDIYKFWKSQDFDNMTSFSVPKDEQTLITEIPEGMLKNCKNLETVTLPTAADGATAFEIGESAFYGCTNLTTVNLGAAIKVPAYAFYGCEKLSGVDLTGIEEIDEAAFSGCSSLTEITLGSLIQRIEKEAFKGCSSLTTVNLGNSSITYIGESAFENCTALVTMKAADTDKGIVLPASLTELGKNAFRGCKSIISATIPDQTMTLNDGAFDSCSSMSCIFIPGEGIEIPDDAMPFSNCSDTFIIYTSASKQASTWGAVWDYISDEKAATVIYDISREKYANKDYTLNLELGDDYIYRLVVPSNATVLPAGVFSGTALQNAQFIYIPSSVQITGKKSVDQTEYGPFYGCTIPDSQLTIYVPFDDADSAIEAWGENWNVSNISGTYDVVYGCKTETDFRFWSQYHYNRLATEKESYSAFNPYWRFDKYYSCIKTIQIPSDVTSIPVDFFKGNSTLASIVIPESVKYIGSGALSGCSALKTVTFQEPDFYTAEYNYEVPDDYQEISIGTNALDSGGTGTDATNWYVVAGSPVYYYLITMGIESDNIHYTDSDGNVLGRPVNITLDANGGYFLSGDAQSATYAEKKTIKCKYFGTIGDLSEYKDILYHNDKDGHSYQLLGFYHSSTYDASKEVESSDMVESEETIYAVWAKNDCAITYDANGGLYAENTETKTFTHNFNDTLTEIDTADLLPVKTGYVLTGWYTGKYGGDVVNNKTVFQKTDDTTYYAHWKKETYKITLKWPDDTTEEGYTLKYVELEYQDEYDLPTPTKDHFIFAGWYTEDTDEFIDINNPDYRVTKNVTLCAKFTGANYNLYLNLNYPNSDDTPEPTGPIKIQYNTYYGDIEELKTKPTLTQYEFLGWYTTASTKEGVEDVEIKLEGDDRTLFLGDKDVTLYARWKLNPVIVTLDPQGGTLPANTASSFEQVYAETYSQLDGVIPSKEGCTFLGWYTEKVGGKKINKGSTCMTLESFTLYAHWSENEVKVIVSFDTQGGNETVDPEEKTVGEPYGTLPTVTKDNNTFLGWYSSATDGAEITADTVVNTDTDHTLYARWQSEEEEEPDDPEGQSYTITLDAQGGECSVKTIKLKYAEMYGTLPTATKTGYTFEGWYTAKLNGSKIMYYTAFRGNADTTVYAHWTAKDPATVVLPFTDVGINSWYREYVQYVYNFGLMTGLTSTTFGPSVTLSRAQFAVILWRMNGSPEMDYVAKFPDVGRNSWYTNAVLWANQAGVVTGYLNGKFGPADNITREQMALMMYRYAKYCGYATTNRKDLSTFSDYKRVSSFATEAMQWAVGAGIITGTDQGASLTPQGKATRAECATIITRFCKLYDIY